MKTALIGTCFVLLTVGLPAQSSLPGSGKRLDLLQGTWSFSRDGREIVEEWQKVKEGFRGRSYFVKNGDTTMAETMEIREIEGDIYYVAAAPGQNKGQAVRFKLVEVSESPDFSLEGQGRGVVRMVFSNPEHDSPRFISYSIGKNSINAAVADDERMQQNRHEYPFQRKAP